MSELAQRLIAENRRTQNPTLDLGNCGLTEMPDLSGMDWLESLNLTNEIPTNNRWWEPFTGGVEGNFDDFLNKHGISRKLLQPKNSISHLPDVFPLFPNLKTIFASQIGLKSLSKFSKSEKLERLFLGFNQLEEIESLTAFPKLKELSIRNNKIISLEPLSQLSELTLLDFENNEVEDIQPLREMNKLRRLVMENNKISSLEPILPIIQKGLPIKVSWKPNAEGIFTANNP